MTDGYVGSILHRDLARVRTAGRSDAKCGPWRLRRIFEKSFFPLRLGGLAGTSFFDSERAKISRKVAEPQRRSETEFPIVRPTQEHSFQIKLRRQVRTACVSGRSNDPKLRRFYSSVRSDLFVAETDP